MSGDWEQSQILFYMRTVFESGYLTGLEQVGKAVCLERLRDLFVSASFSLELQEYAS